MIMDLEKRVLMEKELFTKNWYLNKLRTVKGVVLLDLVKIIK